MKGARLTIKIGANSLSLQNTSIGDFIQTAHDLRLDCVDFHHQGDGYLCRRINGVGNGVVKGCRNCLHSHPPQTTRSER